MKRFLFALAGLAVVAMAGSGRAAVEADPHKEYVIAPAAGPWLICMGKSFHGETAAQEAHDLVLEIRSRYHLPAYVFDRSEEARRQQRFEIEQKQQEIQAYIRSHGLEPDTSIPVRVHHVEPECAVLVGGYNDMDGARKALNDIRKLTPPQSAPGETFLIGPADSGEDQSFGMKPSRPHPSLNESHNEPTRQTVVNPFMTSFVVHNPTVPIERPPDDSAKALRNFNSGESYSIYNCRKPWTLAVASYQGAPVVVSKTAPTSFWDKLVGKGENPLSVAAQNAHELAEALHKSGFEVYVFHTRYRSVVCMGGFDSKDDPRMDEFKLVAAKMGDPRHQDPHVALPFLHPAMPMEVPH